MTSQTTRPPFEMADILRLFGSEYRKQHKLPIQHLKAMSAIERCRSAALGAHVEACDECDYERISYNSCRNRHCPKCQGGTQNQWVVARMQELLPITYYHVVFTVPHLLNPLFLINQKNMYNILFKAASETLLTLSRDPKHLGADVGVIAVLHTWGQNLLDHPHLHCIVTGGGLSLADKKWKVPKKTVSNKNFFIHVNIISDLFKKKFLAYLKQIRQSGNLKYIGSIEYLAQPDHFNKMVKALYDHKWVTFCKANFKKSEHVIRYLGRYTHRIAISNYRIVMIDNKQITFRWKDYRDNNKTKLMTLDANEFIRRFLLHVLPCGFYKIRYYGLLSCRNRKYKIALSRKLLGIIKEINAAVNILESLWQLDVEKFKICPNCGKGQLKLTQTMSKPP